MSEYPWYPDERKWWERLLNGQAWPFLIVVVMVLVMFLC
jgi:hypothetical protein